MTSIMKQKAFVMFYLLIGMFIGALCFFMSPLKAVAVIALLGVIGLTFIRFEAGLCVFLFGMSIVPHMYWNNLYSVLAAVFYLIMYFVNCALKRKKISITSVDFFFVLFALAVVIAAMTSIVPADSFRIFLFFAASLLFSFILASSINSKKSLNLVLFTVYLAVAATSLYAIYQGIVGVEVDPTLTDVEVNKGMPGRVYSTMGNPNNYAEYLILLLPLCAAYVMNIEGKSKKLLFSFGLVLPVIALAITYSRSGWVAFVLAVFVVLFFIDWKLIPIAFVLSLIAVPFLPETIINRAMTIGNLQDSSNAYRIYIWEGVLNMLKDYWATGIGLGPAPFSRIYANYARPEATIAPHSHMLYLEIWVEMGIVAIVSFLWYLVRMVKKSIQNMKKSEDHYFRNIFIASIASITGISFICIAEYVWFYPRTMLVFWITLGIIMSAIKLASSKGENV